MAEIADEKVSIAAGLVPGGTLILPADNQHFDRMAAQAKTHGCDTIVSFGTAGSADAKPDQHGFENHRDAGGGRSSSERVTYDLGVTGKQWAMNTMAVLAAVKAVGGEFLKVPQPCRA